MPDIYSKVVTRWFFGGKGYANRRAACKAKAIKIIKAEIRTKAFQYKSSGEFEDVIYHAWAQEFPHLDELGCCKRKGGLLCAVDYGYGNYGQEVPVSFKYPWCKTAYMKRVNDMTDVLMTEKVVQNA